MKWLQIGVLALLFGLQGCSVLKTPAFVPANPEAMNEWSVEGSVKLKDEAGTRETYFEYKEINGNYQLAVRPNSPVEEPQAVVKGTDGDGKAGESISASNPKAEALAKSLQAALPLNNMSYWLRALPATDQAVLKQNDDESLDEIKDDGWKIQYGDFMEVNSYRLPDEITMKKQDTNVSIDLVRAETGFLTSPCTEGVDYSRDDDASAPSADAGTPAISVVATLVPQNGTAPLPRWIDDHAFCKQLYKVHGKIPDPRVGLFGPGSMMWKLSGPLAPGGMGAGRALLLQTAHPWITAGIDDTFHRPL